MERILTHIFNDNTIEHLHRYAFAINFISGKTVLDIACGEGYGSNLMAGNAAKVIGVDINPETIIQAASKYNTPNLEFRQGMADKIPLPDKSVQVVVSFETIEHHDKHDEMMEEIKRVLDDEGLLIMSSPDKKYYADIPGYRNPYHIKELYADEFRLLIRKYFLHSAFFSQSVLKSSVILPEYDGLKGLEFCTGNYNFIKHNTPPFPLYNMVIASHIALPAFTNSIFNGNEIERYRLADTRENHRKNMEKLKQSVDYKIGSFLLRPLRFIKHLF